MSVWPQHPARVICLLLVFASGCGGNRREAGVEKPVILAFAAPVQTLDPQRHSEDLTRAVLSNFFECLVEFDRDLAIRPKLATDWSNPSDTVWRFRLRPGVRFHDGHELTAGDVEHTIRRAKRIPGSSVEPDILAITEIRQIDPLTVEFVTDRPRPLLLARLAMVPILSRSTADDEIRNPIGTGPFVLQGTASFPARESPYTKLKAIRFDGYWGEKPGFSKLEIRAEPDDSALAASASLGATVISPLPAGGLDAFGSAKSQYDAVHYQTVTIGFLICRIHPLPNGEPSPFADVRVRRALSLAIDRARLVKTAFGEEALPIWQLAMPGIHGFDASLPMQPHAPNEARKLLGLAGFKPGREVTLLTSPRSLSAGQELAHQLADAGIRLSVKGSPWPDRLKKLESGEAHLVMGFWSLVTGDVSGLFEPVLHTRGGPGGFGSENYSGYSNPELDRAIQAASVEMNPAARQARLVAAMRRSHEDVPLIPLYAPIWTYGVKKGTAFSPRLDAAVLGAGVIPGEAAER